MPLRIYYLDDEVMLCENFAVLVSSPEVTVETFQQPSHFLERCAAIVPDLVFMDYRLPGTTGDLVAQKLNPSIPVVLVSGDLQVETAYPFAGMLPKPTPPEEILKLISKFKKT